ncbi:hypothetical protein Tco_1030415 [Tanacetum coccineum]|uniref:Uncharacterized protein n=1 Tax=Tanacetum coccineum TaxID=301880 RepID=A0ABQ5G6T9_9ASTR
MNPRRFPEADHSHGCVTDGLITVPDDHQLNGEVEILIFITTNTTIDTQKESTPPPEEVSPFCEQLISARYGIDSNVRRCLTPSAVLQRPSIWYHDMLSTKLESLKRKRKVSLDMAESQNGQRVMGAHKGVQIAQTISATRCAVSVVIAAFITIEPHDAFKTTTSIFDVYALDGELGMGLAKGLHNKSVDQKPETGLMHDERQSLFR